MDRCDICDARQLEPVYRVPDSARGAEVAVCPRCALVQSLQRPVEPTARKQSLSSDAGWGNVRHGKGIRFAAARPVLERELDWSAIHDALDVGSNRGDFVLHLSAQHPRTRVVAVEPDSSVTGDYDQLPDLTLFRRRLEQTQLQRSFDLVYCCHTLEHAASASEMLAQLHACLRPGGWLYLDVPNLDGLADPNVVEEFFIDKHTFHFSRAQLLCQLPRLGFELRWQNGEDRYNAALLLQRGEAPPGQASQQQQQLAARQRQLIEDYVVRLAANRGRLGRVSAILEPFLARQRVVFWGAGRILDALVRHGGLDTGRLLFAVDEYLWDKIDSIHGISIYAAAKLRVTRPDVVVVLARSAAPEIVEKARKFGVKNVVTFEQLMEQAQ